MLEGLHLTTDNVLLGLLEDAHTLGTLLPTLARLLCPKETCVCRRHCHCSIDWSILLGFLIKLSVKEAGSDGLIQRLT